MLPTIKNIISKEERGALIMRVSQVNLFLALDCSLYYISVNKKNLTINTYLINKEGAIKRSGSIPAQSLTRANIAINDYIGYLPTLNTKEQYTRLQCLSILFIAGIDIFGDYFHFKNSAKQLLLDLMLRNKSRIKPQSFLNSLIDLGYRDKRINEIKRGAL